MDLQLWQKCGFLQCAEPIHHGMVDACLISNGRIVVKKKEGLPTATPSSFLFHRWDIPPSKKTSPFNNRDRLTPQLNDTNGSLSQQRNPSFIIAETLRLSATTQTPLSNGNLNLESLVTSRFRCLAKPRTTNQSSWKGQALMKLNLAIKGAWWKLQQCRNKKVEQSIQITHGKGPNQS